MSAAVRRILVVDDARLDIELALDAFRELQLTAKVDVALGGREALDRLAGAGRFVDRVQFPLPDLVLLEPQDARHRWVRGAPPVQDDARHAAHPDRGAQFVDGGS